MGNGLLFVTDLHLCSSCDSRTGDPLADILSKLAWCIDYCNARGLHLVCGGDWFDTPTVSPEVQNGLLDVLSQARMTVYGVWGNHDLLYRADANKRRCSLYTLRDKITFLDELPEGISMDGYQLCGSLASVASEPAVVVLHSFLDVPDGRYSVSRADLVSVQQPTLVLLGHDHSVYSPEVIGNVSVYRIGSLFRNRRIDSQRRGVYALEVHYAASGVFDADVVVVPSRSFEDIFATGTLIHTEACTGGYDALIGALGGSGLPDDKTLGDALRMVASDDVVDYCLTFKKG